MDATVWAVNPRNDTLDSFVSYTCTYAGDFLKSAGIRCRLDVPEKVPERGLTAEVRHNLFLVVKEALHNVVKHAAAHEVWIRVATRADGFTLAIEDDGNGFDSKSDGATNSSESTGRSRQGNGLRNMRQRVEDIQGCFALNSELGQGTAICVEWTFHPG